MTMHLEGRRLARPDLQDRPNSGSASCPVVPSKKAATPAGSRGSRSLTPALSFPHSADREILNFATSLYRSDQPARLLATA
jgi:hypothetical protein